MNLLELFPPSNYQTVTEWLTALNDYGLGIGAKPSGLLGLGVLTSSAMGVQFWYEIERIGKLVSIEGDPDIEQQLTKAWHYLIELDDLDIDLVYNE